MSDVKVDPVDEKNPVKDIPPPVATPRLTSRSRRNADAWGRWLRVLIFVLLGYTCVQHWRKVLESRDIDEGSWMARALGKHGEWRKGPFGKKAEAAFLVVPNPINAVGASVQYATKPHMAGTPGDFKTATDFLELLQTELGAVAPESPPIYSAGTVESRNATLSIPSLRTPTAWIDVYYPVMNTALDRSLEILDDDGSVVWKAELEEVADDTDPDAGKYFDAVPAWHGLSKGGEAKGKLVYANYGNQEDYDDLAAQGIDLNGTIVIVRYGGIFRGLKVKGAQERGAVGVLIYSDPRDDGTVTAENGYIPYPHGPARNPNSVQRGSTQYLSVYPGDPTTPGYPSYENSTRTEGTNIPKIPSLPISWANAKVLLREIKEDGSGRNRTISLVNHVDDRVIPIWNTMGVIPGLIKDEIVMIGNHRDAWVLGASDPSSGTVSMHEVIRGFGALLRRGWKPLRTIVIASWDAEEYGLIGSTEWGEDFTDFIEENIVAYLNLDSSVSGSRFSPSASPSLAHFVRSAAQDVSHPTKPGKTLWDARQDRGILTGEHIDPEALAMYEEALQAVDEVGIGALGSGSDYTVFLQRAGVASHSGGFGSTLSDPVYHYHSVFDSHRWQLLYGDPGFVRHVAIAKYLGLMTLRMADSVVLPINTTHYAFELEAYLDKVESIASSAAIDVDFDSLRDSIHHLQHASKKFDKEKEEAERKLQHIVKRVAKHRAIRHKVKEIICKIKSVFGLKCTRGENLHACHAHHQHGHGREVEQQVPSVETKSGQVVKPRLGRYMGILKEKRAHEHGKHDEHTKGKLGKHLYKKLKRAVKRVRAVNKKLASFERGFIHEDGIKDREWYRHLGVAPGKWLGYGATTLPALTEAITYEKNATLVQHETSRLTVLIDKLAKEIEL
ncbi:Zn-dependent exopeptidase [Obba rivulosa]|uniref:Zn-dependent exopeptidase n=1 Tax=Obba rivulosa TaxID=1052685 RepID=A0A8E2DR90_9APHY|nr:Zn-dependent exopeptidase [Obba rivulosa]